MIVSFEFVQRVEMDFKMRFTIISNNKAVIFFTISPFFSLIVSDVLLASDVSLLSNTLVGVMSIRAPSISVSAFNSTYNVTVLPF